MSRSVKCPYCNMENNIPSFISDKKASPQIMCCDYEEGGCDKYFVVKVIITKEYLVSEISNMDLR